MMRRRAFYLAPPGDVVRLEAEAESLLDKDANLPIRVILDHLGTHDADLATMLLYRACFRGSNGAFLARLAAQPVSEAPLRRSLKLIVIPGLNFERHPETGADGRLVVDIASRLGAEVEVLATEPRGSASDNGALLARQLGQGRRSASHVITISKGTADFRVALRHLGGWPEWLAGWVNFSGVYQGTPVADKVTAASLTSLMMRALIAMGGLASRNIAEMRTDSPLWKPAVTPPAPGRLIHVVGFPASWSVEPRMAHHYRWLLRHYGPNDGLTPLIEFFDHPGRIVPVWGADHFMRAPDISRLIYRLARHLSEGDGDAP